MGVLLHMVGSSVGIQCYDCNKKDRFREMVRVVKNTLAGLLYGRKQQVYVHACHFLLMTSLFRWLIMILTNSLSCRAPYDDHTYNNHSDQPCPGPLVEYPTSRACRVVALSTGEVVQQVSMIGVHGDHGDHGRALHGEVAQQVRISSP